MLTLILKTFNKHCSKKYALKDFSFTFQNGVYGLLNSMYSAAIFFNDLAERS